MLGAGAPGLRGPATSSSPWTARDSPGSCTRPPSTTPSASPTPPACSARSPISWRCAPCRSGAACTCGWSRGCCRGSTWPQAPGTKMMVNVLASVLEFQRDMISENTRQGVAAAEASGKTLGRPTALAADKAAEIVTAYSQGAAVKALAREHHVAPKTIRRVLDTAGARQLPDQFDALPVHEEPSGPAADTPVTLDLPGLLADHLRIVGDDTIREALIWGRIIRRGKGYSVRLTMPLEFHHAVLQQSTALAAEGAGPAERKAYRVYATRITAAQQQRTPGN
ncbi:recombinase family protein [Actinomadura nitritigenes]|uniref:recombinase family protein n=1 Tax=Actinomadura nitritigenes TaxID=134602 RepID=UPI003D8F4A4D